MTKLTDSRLAAVCAEAARDALVEYEARFDEITRRARDRFLKRDWRGSTDDASERLKLYSAVADRLTSQIEGLMGSRLRGRSIWPAMKAVYPALIAQSRRWEIAESFFNSLTRRVFATEGVDQAIEFVDTDFDAPPARLIPETCRSYGPVTMVELMAAILTDEDGAGLPAKSWSNFQPALVAAAERWARFIGHDASIRAEIVPTIFYRGRGAYVVGRALFDDGKSIPLAFALRHPPEGITLD